MSFACGSSQGPSFSDLASKTKLSVAQISNFYSFFKKCSKSNELCAYSRYCSMLLKVIHTSAYINCAFKNK